MLTKAAVSVHPQYFSAETAEILGLSAVPYASALCYESLPHGPILAGECSIFR